MVSPATPSQLFETAERDVDAQVVTGLLYLTPIKTQITLVGHKKASDGFKIISWVPMSRPSQASRRFRAAACCLRIKSPTTEYLLDEQGQRMMRVVSVAFVHYSVLQMVTGKKGFKMDTRIDHILSKRYLFRVLCLVFGSQCVTSRRAAGLW
jgi:hypothetical protein